jgi:hypothetical protein
LWTRSISDAAFDFVPLVDAVADGAALGDAVAPGVAEAATVVGDDLDTGVPGDSAGARGLAMNPASATPAASAKTSAKGATAKAVPRPIHRIFIEHKRSLESNNAQRRCRDTTRV